MCSHVLLYSGDQCGRSRLPGPGISLVPVSLFFVCFPTQLVYMSPGKELMLKKSRITPGPHMLAGAGSTQRTYCTFLIFFGGPLNSVEECKVGQSFAIFPHLDETSPCMQEAPFASFQMFSGGSHRATARSSHCSSAEDGQAAHQSGFWLQPCPCERDRPRTSVPESEAWQHCTNPAAGDAGLWLANPR